MESLMVRSVTKLFVCLSMMLMPVAAYAQAETSPPPVAGSSESEDIQPRIVGHRGTTQIGFAGFFDRVYSSEKLFPLNYTVQIDAGRFITKRFVARLGLVGSGSRGGDNSVDLATGPGAPSVYATGGLMFYFTPESIMSLYTDVEYWAQLTQRPDADSGSVVGKAGLQASVSSRASLFFEGGYGVRLTRGDGGELMTRIIGQVGLRIKF
jgi:hypothetical protein